jgi:hypothetical protein
MCIAGVDLDRLKLERMRTTTFNDVATLTFKECDSDEGRWGIFSGV